MTAIDHHSMIGDSNIATVTCACAAAVAAAAVVASVGLQMNRRLEHVAFLSLLLVNQGVPVFANISSIRSTILLFQKSFPTAGFQQHS